MSVPNIAYESLFVVSARMVGRMRTLLEVRRGRMEDEAGRMAWLARSVLESTWMVES